MYDLYRSLKNSAENGQRSVSTLPSVYPYPAVCGMECEVDLIFLRILLYPANIIAASPACVTKLFILIVLSF